MTGGRQNHKQGQPGDSSRAERLKLALRQNLKRRKAQSKAREQTAGEKAHDSAGFGGEGAADVTGDQLKD